MKKTTVISLAGLGLCAVGLTCWFFWVGNRHDWGARQYGAFSAWVFGLATFTGVISALVQSHYTRKESAADQRRIEHRRRVDLEVAKRQNGIAISREVVDRLIEAQVKLADGARLAAHATGDEIKQRSIGLDTTLAWTRLRPEIGVRIIPIAQTQLRTRCKHL